MCPDGSFSVRAMPVVQPTWVPEMNDVPGRERDAQWPTIKRPLQKTRLSAGSLFF
jgi:hypothetical protein